MSKLVSDSTSDQIRHNLLKLEGITHLANCRRGTALFSAQDRADCVYFLQAGRVKILKQGPDDKEVLLTIVEAGELFGEQAIISEEPWEVAAEVLEDAEVYVVPREPFLKYCSETPEIWPWLVKLFGSRQRALERKIELLLFYEVEQRILRSLERLAAQCEMGGVSGQPWAINLSQKELASMIGSTRETTSSALNQLSKRGLVELQRRRVIIPSLAAVRSAISGSGVETQSV